MTTLFAAIIPSKASATGVEAAQRSVPRVVAVVQDASGASDGSLGTGFAIAPDIIVTNRHVIELAEGRSDAVVAVIGPAGEARVQRAEIIAVGGSADLAILRVPGADFVPLTLTRQRVGSDVRVRAIGYPGVVDRMVGADAVEPSTPEVTEGSVSSYRTVRDDSDLSDGMVHTATISQGNSGGPLVDECGRVIGVNTAIDVGRGSFAFAQGVDVVAELARNAGVDVRMAEAPCGGAIEEARQRSLAEQQRQADKEREQADEIERMKAEVAQRDAARDAAAAAAQRAADQRLAEVEASNRMTIALSGLGLAIMGVVLAIALRRRELKSELGWASALILVAGVAVLWWWQSAKPSQQLSPLPSGSQPMFVEPNLPQAGSSQAGMEGAGSISGADGSANAQDGHKGVSDEIVGSNLGKRDEALMRDASLGAAFNCRFEAGASRDSGGSEPPPERIDMRLDLESGCLMGRTQYASVNGRFERLSLDSETRAAILTSIDPDSGRFRRIFAPLSSEQYSNLDADRQSVRSNASCNSTQAGREANFVAANRDLFEAAAGPDLVWTCRVRREK